MNVFMDPFIFLILIVKTVEILSFSRSYFEFTIISANLLLIYSFFANLLSIHYFFREIITDSSSFPLTHVILSLTQIYFESIIFFSKITLNSLLVTRIHYLFREFTKNPFSKTRFFF